MSETITKPLELTEEEQNTARIILDGFVERGNIALVNAKAQVLKEAVPQVCQDLDNAKIPKHTISTLVCKEASKFGVTERYLRTFIPVEYKDQAQREVRLTHEGGTEFHQHEPNSNIEPTTLQVHSEDDIQPIHEDPVSTPSSTSKKIGSYTQKLKSELDHLRIDTIQFRNRNGITFVYECLMDELPESELGKKIKEYFSKNKWYLDWLKEKKKHEASLNIKGKTREQVYLDQLKKTCDERDEKERQEAEKLAKKQAEKNKPVEPKDLSKIYKDKNKKKSKV